MGYFITSKDFKPEYREAVKKRLFCITLTGGFQTASQCLLHCAYSKRQKCKEFRLEVGKTLLFPIKHVNELLMEGSAHLQSLKEEGGETIMGEKVEKKVKKEKGTGVTYIARQLIEKYFDSKSKDEIQKLAEKEGVKKSTFSVQYSFYAAGKTQGGK